MILLLLAILRIPQCQFDLGDATFLPSPCRYTLPSGEWLVVRRPDGAA